MLGDLIVASYAVCIGFVSAGIIGSFFQLLNDSPPRFDFSAETIGSIISAIFVCLFAGPFIIMRNAIRGRRIEQRPVGWLVASSTIAGMWSLCSGIVILQFALAFAHSV